MSIPNHQITKRELIEMLEPFEDHDKIEIHFQYRSSVGTKETDRHFINRVDPVNGGRSKIAIKTYEA